LNSLFRFEKQQKSEQKEDSERGNDTPKKIQEKKRAHAADIQKAQKKKSLVSAWVARAKLFLHCAPCRKWE